MNNDNGLRLLQEKTEEKGGVFHVKSIPLEESSPEKIAAGNLDAEKPLDSEEILAMLGEMLSAAELVIGNESDARESFEMILRRKFVEKADEYPFLDPFADEFAYAQGTIRFNSEASATELAAALRECLFEIAGDWNVGQSLASKLLPMRQKYPAAVSACLPNF